MVNELSEIVKDLKFEPVESQSWEVFQPEKAVKDGIEYLRKKGSDVIYKHKEEGYECLNCSSEILAARVAHPIHDGPFPMSGSGKCHYESVPYCPKCEEVPNFHGSPITAKSNFF
jgi:hypothetical protein